MIALVAGILNMRARPFYLIKAAPAPAWATLPGYHPGDAVGTTRLASP